MMIISSATKDEVKEFNIREWHGVDVEHYGRPVEWNQKDFLFKATDGDEILGTVSGEHESGVIYIYGLIVAEGKRGQGIGKALMEKAEAFGKEMKAHKIHLITGKDWGSNKFYESLGYKKIADLPQHHFRKDFVVYNKFI